MSTKPLEPTKILILDGGFGTTLEDLFQKDISSPLWSAKPVEHEPEVIINAHLAFLRAGADVILTSTYQCAYETFARAGYTPDDAIRLMRKAVHLAYEAKRRYQREEQPTGHRHQQKEIKIALSLGSFGSTLSPTQEFGGMYPPPYGPNPPTSRGHPGEEPTTLTNSFEEGEEGGEERAVEELARFHVERLRVFAQDKETWDMIDWVAFETVPLRREIRAIRKAMGIVQEETKIQLPVQKSSWLWDNLIFGGARRAVEMVLWMFGVHQRDGDREQEKPWWISAVFPDGKSPEQCRSGEHVTLREVVEALVGGGDPIPKGIGINCTDTKHLGTLLGAFTEGVKGRRGLWDSSEMPSLVLYPNGGDVWNHKTKSWIPTRPAGEKARCWAESVANVVGHARDEGVWKEIVVGGCCKVGPAEITALSEQLQNL